MSVVFALAIALGLIGYSLQGWLFAVLFPAAFLALVLPVMKSAIALEMRYSVKLEENSKVARFLGLSAGRIGALCLFGLLVLAMIWMNSAR